MLSLLLQELYIARSRGLGYVHLSMWQLSEDPVSRLNRLIKTSFWNHLIRTIDKSGITLAVKDTKTVNSQPRIYIPHGAPEQFAYYSRIAREDPSLHLDVQWLPKGEITPEFIKSLNHKPGILALQMETPPQGDPSDLKGLPFIVPGGRFNEFYYWDSYFSALGMVDSHPYIVKSIIQHFVFEIKHYGKILNANRSYYLGRSQPPFLTDLAMKTYRATYLEPDARDLLKLAILAARKEYLSLWTAEPRLDRISGLSRYRPIGLGFPPECEPTQFDHIIEPYAKRYNTTVKEFTEAYNNGDIQEPDLDEFCVHDRAVRESGHDTSNRLENVCADIATVDLNCLLYRYETDISYAIRNVFGDRLEISPSFFAPSDNPCTDHSTITESSAPWDRRARNRKTAINRDMWDSSRGLFLDYNTRTNQAHNFESSTVFYTLWSGLASPSQASLLVSKALPLFELPGGLSSSTISSRGIISPTNPQKQWEFPHGWPPHQVMAWEGLAKYGYHEDAERLAYRWCSMIVKVFSDYNGTVVEKYDVSASGVENGAHKVSAEYGNQGTGFEGAPREG